jgi:ribonuclease P protein component
VGKAVERNRAKRLMRALFLLYLDRIEPGEYVWVAKPALLEQDFARLDETARYALRRCGVLNGPSGKSKETSDAS